MNILVPMILFLFIFGAVSGVVNEMGLFDTKLPTTGSTINRSSASSLQSGAVTQPTSEFNWIEVLRTFMVVIGTGALCCFEVITLLHGFGVPLYMAMMLQAPITLVTVFGLWELWMGRSVE